MSSSGGPGAGPWQETAEQALGLLQRPVVWLEGVVLNPDKSYTVEWLELAATDASSAHDLIRQAIRQARHQIEAQDAARTAAG